jgi:hypothetical protein
LVQKKDRKSSLFRCGITNRRRHYRFINQSIINHQSIINQSEEENTERRANEKSEDVGNEPGRQRKWKGNSKQVFSYVIIVVRIVSPIDPSKSIIMINR